jgi:hypothetical protein
MYVHSPDTCLFPFLLFVRLQFEIVCPLLTSRLSGIDSYVLYTLFLWESVGMGCKHDSLPRERFFRKYQVVVPPLNTVSNFNPMKFLLTAGQFVDPMRKYIIC